MSGNVFNPFNSLIIFRQDRVTLVIRNHLHHLFTIEGVILSCWRGDAQGEMMTEGTPQKIAHKRGYRGLPILFLTMRATFAASFSGDFMMALSHTRATFHPVCKSWAFIRKSRSMFRLILATQ